MLQARDYEMFNFIEQFGGITIRAAALLFFSKAKYAEDLARKRLKKLYEKEYLKFDEDFTTNRRVYYINKKPSSHTILLSDFYTKLRSSGTAIIDFKREFEIPGGRADALTVFQHQSISKMCLIEIDMQHKTNLDKYQEAYESGFFQGKFGTFPLVIIVTCHKRNNYSYRSYPFKYVFLNYKFDDFKEKVLY